MSKPTNSYPFGYFNIEKLSFRYGYGRVKVITKSSSAVGRTSDKWQVLVLPSRRLVRPVVDDDFE